MCHGPWKEHGAQYYECSKFKVRLNTQLKQRHHFNQIIQEEGAGQIDTDARVSLTKYLHYFQRWENHCRSLKVSHQRGQQNLNCLIARSQVPCQARANRPERSCREAGHVDRLGACQRLACNYFEINLTYNSDYQSRENCWQNVATR